MNCPMCEEDGGATAERDELREQVARLEEECSEAMLNALHMRAALEEYGRHIKTCFPHIWPDAGCTCGLAEALESKP